MKHNVGKYLYIRDGIYYMRFRLPANFGGRIIQTSLQTRDPIVAIGIRDRYIIPLLTYKNVIEILQNISEQIAKCNNDALRLSETLPALIAGKTEDKIISEVIKLYLAWLQKSGNRPASIKNYQCALQKMVQLLPDKAVSSLTKNDAISLRDKLIEQKISGVRIEFIFRTFKQFLRWSSDEGYCCKSIDDRFKIELPKPNGENTAMIPPEMADKAMNIYSSYTLAPRIARYTGMRLSEVHRIAAGIGENKIIVKHGILCFYLDEMSKTGKTRIIPVAEKLKPYIKEFCTLSKSTKKSERYNVLIKTIPGCEKCSFHSWRVYANTTMMEAGIDRAVRMAILGHSTGDDIHAGYTAARLETLKKAVDLIP